MVDEGKWVVGEAEDHDQEEEYDPGWEISEWIDLDDLSYIAGALGLL